MKRPEALELQTWVLEQGLHRVDARGFRHSGRGGGAQEAGMSFQPATELAVGISGGGDNFELAVRASRDGEDIRAAVTAMREEGPVDFRVVGRIAALAKPWYRSKVRPLWPGCSCAHRRVGLGTLGCFVALRDDSNRWPHILSNNHVLAREREDFEFRPKDWVFQPADSDDEDHDDDTIARLAHWVPLVDEGNLVDAAVARLDESVAWQPDILDGLGILQGIRPASQPLGDGGVVYKIGRTTGLRTGRVKAQHLQPVSVGFRTKVRSFVNVLEIEPQGPDLFCDYGDSGSLIVDAQLRAVGLLFAKADQAGTGYANPIHAVLDALKVDLLTDVTT